jgi:hypothetical protein
VPVGLAWTVTAAAAIWWFGFSRSERATLADGLRGRSSRPIEPAMIDSL